MIKFTINAQRYCVRPNKSRYVAADDCYNFKPQYAPNPLLYDVLVGLFVKFFCLGIVKFNFALSDNFIKYVVQVTQLNCVAKTFI